MSIPNNNLPELRRKRTALKGKIQRRRDTADLLRWEAREMEIELRQVEREIAEQSGKAK